jgi:hypothetical protein
MTIGPRNTIQYASTGDGTVHTSPIALPPIAGHLLTATIATTSTPTVTGWTKITGSTNTSATELAQYWRWSTGTETSVVATVSPAGPCTMDVSEWFGLTNIGPDVSAHATNTSTSNPASGTTASLAASGELVLAAFSYTFTAPNTTPGFTPPAGYTTLGNFNTTNGVGTGISLAVCYTLAASAAAQTATGTYTAPKTASGNIVAYLEATTLAAGQLYPKFKESLLTQSPSIDMDTDPIKAAIGRGVDGFTYDPTNQFFSDVESVMATGYSAAVTVPGIFMFGGFVETSSPHIQFNVTTGAELDFLILFDDQGSAAASPLVAYVPLASPVLPVAGKVVQVDWDTGTRALNGILKI